MAGCLRRAVATALIGASLALVLPANRAIAASCSALRAELASARSGRVDRARAESYASASRRQATELAVTKRMASRQGCRRVRTSECSALTATIERMEKRMAELDRQRRRALGGGGRSRASIQGDLRRAGCDATPSRKATPSQEATPRKNTASRPAIKGVAKTKPVEPAVGTYRTVCVRTCDGYFFPIRNMAARNDFAVDTKQCRSMCPRAETRLFVHETGSDPSTMFDRTGRRYSEMPYAYRHAREDYRHTEACSCGRPLAPIRRSALRGTVHQSVPSPLGIAPPVIDAETRRNAALGFGWRDAKALAGSAGPLRERRVRVVGPAYLPDQAAEAAR